MIRIQNVKKTFNSRSSAKNQVLKGVSFELPDKGLFAIFGKSGSGKTTILNIIGGLEKADSGQVIIDGENMNKKTDFIRNQKIGFVFQNYYLERGYTVSEIMRNAMLLAGFRDENEIKKRTEEVLLLVDMERFKNKMSDALSGGQKQRVAIARALIKGSDIILADEPTGNLDAQNTYKVMDVLKEISKTKLVVLVTHEVTLIKKYADGYVKLVDGELWDNAVLDEAEKANITYGEKTEDVDTQALSYFSQSSAKKNGRLFTMKNTLRSIMKGTDEQNYSSGNVFKQIFIFAMAVLISFFSLFSFEAFNIRTANKPVNENCKYVNMRSYSEVRKLSSDLYDNIDFYELDYATGNFSYKNLQSLSEIMVNYSPKSLGKNDTAESVSLEFGTMPKESQVLITRSLAETLKKELRINELENDRSLSLMLFENTYAVSGIVDGEYPYVYFNRVDYVNFLGVYKEIYFTDNTNLFFPTDFTDAQAYKTYNNYSAEICVYDGNTIDLKNNQCVVEVNRNAIYKMMSDTTQADYRMEIANATLLKSPEFISISDSFPMYVRQFKLTRTVMTTDIRIYVTEEALENIFVYIAPNLDTFGSNAQYYFEITTNGEEQFASLSQRLSDRGIVETDIVRLQDSQNEEKIKSAYQTLMIFAWVCVLMYLIYFFIEKSGSVKNSKEYGIYRAIGVNRSNLLFKETSTAIFGNLGVYLVGVIIMTVLMCVRYYIMNIAFGAFIGLVAIFFGISSLLMIGISLIPYLFVLTQSPSQILSRYDI